MALPQSLASFVVEKPRAEWPGFGFDAGDALKVLRFEDRNEQIAAFASAGIEADAPAFSWRGVGDVSIVGSVIETQPVYDGYDRDGFPIEVSPATYLPGWYVNILVPEPPSVIDPDPPAGTPLTAANFQRAIELHVDAVAGERGYSSGVSLATYAGSVVPLWAAEALAFIAWRDAVWVYALTELAKVQAGQREAPESTGALVRELPAMEWPEG